MSYTPKTKAASKAAKNLRTNQTDAEKVLWHTLRSKELGGYKFRRQYPVGNYVVDFVCLAHKLAIEIDGGHHADITQKDEIRSGYLKSHGFKVLRFWNNEVMGNLDGVLETIVSELESLSPHPSPLPQGEGTI